MVNAKLPNMTWLVFDPFEYNIAEWEETYGIYISTQQSLINGRVLIKAGQVDPALDAAYYIFDSSASFKGPFIGPGAPGAGAYRVKNEMPNTKFPALVFGLEQQAEVNGIKEKAAMNYASLIPAFLQDTFTPQNTIIVWLQKDYTSATYISNINGNATYVHFEGALNKVSLVYDPKTGFFIPSKSKDANLSLEDTPNIKFVERGGLF